MASDTGPNNVTGFEGWREMRAESVEVDFSAHPYLVDAAVPSITSD
jgi:hypothetical protein